MENLFIIVYNNKIIIRIIIIDNKKEIKNKMMIERLIMIKINNLKCRLKDKLSIVHLIIHTYYTNLNLIHLYSLPYLIQFNLGLYHIYDYLPNFSFYFLFYLIY